jgi:outer membrane receptor protein involved in Fe transport
MSRRFGGLAAGALAVLTAARAADEPLAEQIVVTAVREPAPSLTLVGNTARIEGERVDLLGATHVSQLGAQAAGTWLSRGTEQESLPAIRSPVLTGPGSCGAFLMLEDGVPVRPAGFCNVNELFEIDTEQASAMEAVRGPVSVLYGANALHGALNFLLPAPGSRSGLAASAEVGPYDYRRGQLLWDTSAGGDPLVAGFSVDHDGDFRDSAGYDQAKGFVKLDHSVAAGQLLVGFAGSVLNQETAGFITGYKAYENETLRTQNLNPEAYRDADSERLSLRWIPAADHAWAGTDLRAFLRRSGMDFLQHFLPGQPREENGQWSGGVMITNQRPAGSGNLLTSGLDLEIAEGYLKETQAGDSGVPSIPPGKHYDYEAQSFLLAPFAQLSVPIADAWSVQLGLRAEYMLYAYDNRMIDGNMRDDGTPCTPAPCRFNRPADRSDDFLNVAPSTGLLYRIAPQLAAYLNLARGFRPPQATELYRLQAQQSVADLDSETLDSAEFGLHWQTGISRVELAAFAMKKRHFIFQDSSRANVSDGKTRHLGMELQADLRLPSGLYGGFAGTYAKHTYAFSATTPGGEAIVSGSDIDTAPRTLASARLGYERSALRAEIEWAEIGSYYLDAGNLTTYSGHNLFNLRGAWRATKHWSIVLRVNNLSDKLYAERADFVSFPSPTYRYFPGREREAYLEVAFGGI